MSCSCNGNTGDNDDDTCSCNGHDGSAGACTGHSGYVSATTITFTNDTVSVGEEIDYENEIHELLDELNDESDRRAVLGESSSISLTLTDPVSSNHVRQIRDLYIDILNTTSSSPITDTQIAVGEEMMATTIETMKDGIISDSSTCVCDCNYSCTCDCNYCTCNCDYCTCVCNHSCKCNCNYSDINLKTNIVYF